MEDNVFVNKVHASGIVTVDLMDYAPLEEVVSLDIREFLFMGLIIREKEFKDAIGAYDWEALRHKAVAVCCSEDTIIPTWVYFMIADRLYGIASRVDYRPAAEVVDLLWRTNIQKADFTYLAGKKAVVKANPKIAPDIFMTAVDSLRPFVATLMYGEAGMPKVIYKR
ncbi:DUF2480 family protein [Sphingobacterium faecale]|uniref:DUF2480 family protein n=1 Tax=Sphingobacterium faecale TaxID=2803775 RepID=A0ABS1R003_9SPHI|nr:DUF2480 family protein [Sphingobacterium faecale]MBL1408021.1 DUF2480 family protein [Sphingobacterium faecale]